MAEELLKIKTIVFVENADDAERYIRRRSPDVLGSALFIAMRPSAYTYLTQAGFPVHNTLQYFNNDSHSQGMIKSTTLVDWLDSKLELSEDRALRDAGKNWFLFLTRFVINYSIWTIEIVLNAIEIHKPEKIVAMCRDKQCVASVYMEPEEGCLGRLVEAIAHSRGIRFETIDREATIPQIALSNRLLARLRLLSSYLARYGGVLLLDGAELLKQSLSKKKKVTIFTTKMYGMGRLADELGKETDLGKTYFLRGPVLPYCEIPDAIARLLWRKKSKMIIGQKAVFRSLAAAIGSDKKEFTYRDISFRGIVAGKVNDAIAPYVIGQLLWNSHLDRFLAALRPSIIITNGNRPDDVHLADICRQRRIETLFISHGSFVAPKNEPERIEWGEHGRAFMRGNYSACALQSPLTEGYLDAFNIPAKRIRTGPLIWGTAVNKERSKALFRKMVGGRHGSGATKVVLHAGTPKASSVLRFHIYETPDEYIQALRDLSYAVEKLPGTLLIIKFRPSSEISASDIKNSIPFSDRVILSIDEPLLDILGMSDLVVSFSSTVIEEALQNNIPVLLYGGGGRYQHVPAQEIKCDGAFKRSAVCHVREAKDLTCAITRMLEMEKEGDDFHALFSSYIYDKRVRTPLAAVLEYGSEECR